MCGRVISFAVRRATDCLTVSFGRSISLTEEYLTTIEQHAAQLNTTQGFLRLSTRPPQLYVMPQTGMVVGSCLVKASVFGLVPHLVGSGRASVGQLRIVVSGGSFRPRGVVQSRRSSRSPSTSPEPTMTVSSDRRTFLQASAALAVGGLGFLDALPAVAADDAKLDPELVRLDADIEPLVRLLEDAPRQQLLEEVGARVKKGLAYRDVLAALLLAGVRNIKPRPNVGFKFHAVMVVNSAHQAALAGPDRERWLPPHSPGTAPRQRRSTCLPGSGAATSATSGTRRSSRRTLSAPCK